MKLDEIVAWYQKKIGTYDKEQWEKTVEQKILDGFTSVTLKTAKLKTDLIDVDLVRGSTFPKAKPKQSLLTVIRLAILRYFFLPLYAQWWVKQTSPNIFALLLTIYITQMVSWALYTFNIERMVEEQQECLENNSTICSEVFARESPSSQNEESIVSVWDLIIPMALSLLLSLIHSQIVATNTLSSAKNKRRRFSNTGQCNKLNREGNRVRRRKKLVKVRNDGFDNSSLQKKSPTLRLSPSGVEVIQSSVSMNHLTKDIEPSFANTNPNIRSSLSHGLSKLSLAESSETLTLDLQNACPVKKRNVNWQLPLQNNSDSSNKNYPTVQTKDQQQQTSPQTASSSSSESILFEEQQILDQCNDKALNVPLTASQEKTFQNVDNQKDLNKKTNDLNNIPLNLTNSLPNLRQRRNLNLTRTVGEDDGFESLNGKSSSGEDTMHLRNPLRYAFNTNGGGSSGSGIGIGISHNQPRFQQAKTQTHSSSDETDEEGDDDIDIASSPATASKDGTYNECTISATEWLGITTNSEECSYSSDLQGFEETKTNQNSDLDDMDFTPTTILYPHNITERISCTLWDHQEVKKAQMSVLEISSCIIDRVESMPETNDYIYIGLGFSFLLSFIPCICRLCEVTIDSLNINEISYLDLPMLIWEKASFSFLMIFHFAFGHTQWERIVLLISFFQRLCLTMILFIIFAVAERAFKQRFLYAKLFSHLTSSRRARKSNVPHFRLNKVRNIKTWLSVRSYLKKRGPQRSVDVIVSAAFLVTLLLLSFLSVEWLKDSVHLHSHLNLEALMWSVTIGIFLLRYMTLGSKIQKKYRSVSVLITEQINLYLQIEQKPKKKDELMVSNSVLKLAADLLKELESPFKISGLSTNPYVFTTIKVVILSALSGVLSEILGFKLKLHKIKIK